MEYDHPSPQSAARDANLTSSPDIHADFRDLLGGGGLDPKDTGGEVTFTGADPILPSRHRLGAIMAMGMMGPAVATQILHRMRGGPAQDLSVDLCKAMAHITSGCRPHPRRLRAGRELPRTKARRTRAMPRDCCRASPR